MRLEHGIDSLHVIDSNCLRSIRTRRDSYKENLFQENETTHLVAKGTIYFGNSEVHVAVLDFMVGQILHIPFPKA